MAFSDAPSAALIVGSLGYIGVTQGAEAASENALFWFLINAVPCAIGGTLELTAFEQPAYGRIELDAILLALESGRAYLNLHTTVFGMGEIRGNLGSPVVER